MSNNPVGGVPAWVPKGAFIHMDFADDRYYGIEMFKGPSSRNRGAIDGNSNTGGKYTLSRGGIYVPNVGNTARITTGYGIWGEEARLCNLLQNRTLTNAAWTKTNCAVAKNRVGIDGVANSAHTLTPSGANWSISQAMTITSQIGVFSVFLQRTAALNGTVAISLDNNSTTTDVTALLAAAAVGQWVRVYAEQTLANPTVVVSGSNASDVIGIDFPVHEVTTVGQPALISPVVPTSPILTTSSAVSIFNEESVFGTFSSNLNEGLTRIIRGVWTYGGPWAMRIRYCGLPTATKPGWLISSDGNVIIQGGADGGPCTFQASNSPNNGNRGIDNWNVMCGRVLGKGAQVCLNGGELSTLATGTNSKPVPPSTVFTHAGICNNGGSNNAYPLNGPISHLTFWRGEITDGFMRDQSYIN